MPMKKSTPESLPRREREVLDAVFALRNRATVEDVRARLHRPPSYSAVRAMLARLEAKGHLKHQQDGLRYVYSATTSPRLVMRATLERYLRTFFDGSVGQLMTTLLQQEDWSDEELDALQREIDRVRNESKNERK
jgi:predicted transcriptional regulator